MNKANILSKSIGKPWMMFVATILMSIMIAAYTLPVSAATLLPLAETTFLDANGAPLAGGSVFFYIPNTTTPKDTWMDAAGTMLNTNPVLLNSAGRAIIYGTGSYRQVVKDVNGNTIWDQVTQDTAATTGITWGGTSSGTANAQTVVAAGFAATAGAKLLFIAGLTNTGALTVNPNGSGGIVVLKSTPTGAQALTGGEVSAGNLIELDYDGTEFNVINPVPTAAINLVITGALTGTGSVTFNGAIRPTAISGTTNDYAPAGFSGAYFLGASAAGAQTITGLAGGVAGRQIIFGNIGSTTITLTANYTGSLAANRFLFAHPVILRPNESIALQYDGTATGWRALAPLDSQPVAGAFANLKVQTTSNTLTTVSADAETLSDANGETYRAISPSLSIDITTVGANGLDTGSAADQTFYSVWTIYNPTTNTVAGLESTSTTSPSLPSGYTYKMRDGWVITDSSAHLLRTLQYGRIAEYVIGTNPTIPPLIATGTAGTISSSATLTLAAVTIQAASGATAFVPLTASRVFIAGNTTYLSGGSGDLAVAPSTAWGGTNRGPAGTAGNSWPLLLNASSGTTFGGQAQGSTWLTLESTQIAWASAASGGSIACLGWEDNL